MIQEPIKVWEALFLWGLNNSRFGGEFLEDIEFLRIKGMSSEKIL